MASLLPTSRVLDRQTWRRFDVHCFDGDALRTRGAALTSRGFDAQGGRDKGEGSRPGASPPATSRGTAEAQRSAQTSILGKHLLLLRLMANIWHRPLFIAWM